MQQSICLLVSVDGRLEFQDKAADCDKDGVINSADIIPNGDDRADYDRDSVPDDQDVHPGLDDRDFDFDQDGISDYLDPFDGYNYGDDDDDGRMNANDKQPKIAPPSGRSIPRPLNYSPEQLSQLLVKDKVRERAYAIATGLLPVTYTLFEDSDGDGEIDFYDRHPTDSAITSDNEPYDPKTEEFWLLN